MTAAVLSFPGCAERPPAPTWSAFEIGMREVFRVRGKSQAYADEIARRLKPMLDLLAASDASPLDESSAEPALRPVLNQLLRERLNTEMAALDALATAFK